MHRERLIITCELEVIRHKNELLHTSTVSNGYERNVHIKLHINIKAVSKLLSEFSGVDLDFQQWEKTI